jgi:hypothetical protein
MRYSDYLNAVSFHHKTVSYNVLAPKIDPSAPKVDKRLDITLQQSLALIGPYCYTRIMDQVKAVVPLAAYLILFQILILRHPIDSALMLGGGLVAVIVGLAIFMEGLNTGLMPFGTIIGDNLPKKASMTVVLIIIGMLGVGVTFAEPAIGALQAFGSSVDVNSAPYLYELLNNWTLPLVLMVGAGVGLAAILGTVRFVRGWSLKPMIYCALVPVMILTGYAWLDPNLRSVLGLAWDCGAVTTGPVTVPLVLSLGIGIANAAGKGQSSLSGFGVVTLASLFPILAVLILAIFMSLTVTPDEIREAAQLASDAVAVFPPCGIKRL